MQDGLVKMTGASHPTWLPFDVSQLVAHRAVWLWDKAVKAGEGGWAFSPPCQSPLLFFVTFLCEHLLLWWQNVPISQTLASRDKHQAKSGNSDVKYILIEFRDL